MYKKNCDKVPARKLARCVAGTMATACTVFATCTAFTSCSSSNKTSTDSNLKYIKEEEKNRSDVLIAKELTTQYQNKATRALESVRTQIGEEAYLSTIATVGSSEQCKSQGEYISSLLENVIQVHGEDTATTVMRACGYQCISTTIIETAKKLYDESANLEEFIQKLNAKEIGGGKLTLKHNTITAVYDQCYCDIDNLKRDKTKCYCQCSCGWFEKLFFTVLEQTISVNLEESIKNGGQNCTFAITIEEQK